ncbi:hypothetical protein HHX47_DHR5000761 [Lentinula edodes]|nr:hypothetical protein HHX47_DHR5000761 [Lentinula edodes]
MFPLWQARPHCKVLSRESTEATVRQRHVEPDDTGGSGGYGQRIGFCPAPAVDAGLPGPISESASDFSSSSYVDSQFSFEFGSTGTPNKNNLSTMTTRAEEKPVRYEPNTPEWVAQWLQMDKLPMAIGILRAWMPESRVREASEETVLAVRNLSHATATEAVTNLKSHKRFVRGTRGRELKLRTTIKNIDNGVQIETEALLDSGATGSCINKDFVEQHHLTVKELPVKMPVYNADGTLNKNGSIEGYVQVRMVIGDHAERIDMAVTNLGKTDIFLGIDWLRYHNPSIDWKESTLTFERCPDKCGYLPHYESPEDDGTEEKLVNGERIFWFDWDGYLSDQGHIKVQTATTDAATPYLAEYADVFSKKDFDQMPERRPWDHAIELTPGSKPVDCKVYPLSPPEQKALDEFLEENLRSGRIRPSRSPMASPFFFVKKKDGTLRPVQDYRKLNDMTVKNRYPLPLIQELIDKLKNSKIFTKMDVRWGFNNIRIKEGDEWKAAFRTNRGLFEPTVMFFGLTNSPADTPKFWLDVYAVNCDIFTYRFVSRGL